MVNSVSRENLKLLIDGKLPWDETKKMLRMQQKEKERFWEYLTIKQGEVPWDDNILLPLTDHLYIVRTKDGQRIVKCGCGHELGDYRCNWKFTADIYVRRTPEEFQEVYTTNPCAIDPSLVEIREYYCPDCSTLLAVETVPPGYPPLFDMLPDLDTLYREWLSKPLEDESPDWYQDKTADMLTRWSTENQALSGEQR